MLLPAVFVMYKLINVAGVEHRLNSSGKEITVCVLRFFGSSANIQQWASPFTAGVSYLVDQIS